MLNQAQIDFFLLKAYHAAVRAGARVLDFFVEERAKEALPLSELPFSHADAASHELIKSYLSRTRIPMLSAEGRDLLYEERCHWDLFWMVDPLDGTQEFLRGSGEFTVNIALMAENRPVIGIIYVPYLRKLYWALQGHGAYLKTEVEPRVDFEATLDDLWHDNRPLPLWSRANDPVRIAISRSHNNPQTFEWVDRLRQRYSGAEVVEQGSSYKFCLLAEASVDLYVRTSNTYEWDTAAGELILREAGGSLTTLDGQPFTYNKLVLNNPYFLCKNKYL